MSIVFFVPQDIEPIYYSVWIDFNHNNTFEATELVMRNNNTSMAALPVNGEASVTLTKTFAIPAGLTAGNTRMRIRRGQKETGNIYVYDNAFSLDPCPNYTMFGNTYGYTYDFNVTIGGGGGTPPDAAFTASTTTATVNNTTVTFTDQSLNAPTARNWSFNPNTVTFQNGTTAISANPQVSFNNAGLYTAKLIVSNAYGSDTAVKPNYINVVAPQGPPHADFTADVTNATKNVTVVTLTDLSTTFPTSRYWRITPGSFVYQNNTNATSPYPKLLFTAVGDYTVKLKVANAEGTDSTTKQAYIHVTSNSTAIQSTAKDENLLCLYPNPAGDVLNFEINKNSKIKAVTIINAKGKVVNISNAIKGNQLGVANLAKGIYFIQITFENGSVSSFRKFTKM